jgi:hypothetical protein|uniref:Uncharacterized protein n=1 Tax=uncultured marine virus TaxID=186617 RepID=A0A0F7L0K4_9VIRU|nr:hypothetical protein [uncultured marine virus]
MKSKTGYEKTVYIDGEKRFVFYKQNGIEFYDPYITSEFKALLNEESHKTHTIKIKSKIVYKVMEE